MQCPTFLTSLSLVIRLLGLAESLVKKHTAHGLWADCVSCVLPLQFACPSDPGPEPANAVTVQFNATLLENEPQSNVCDLSLN